MKNIWNEKNLMKNILKKGQSFHLAPAGNLISALNPLRPQMWAAGPDVQFNLLTMVVVMMVMVMVMIVMMMVMVMMMVKVLIEIEPHQFAPQQTHRLIQKTMSGYHDRTISHKK